MNQFPVRFALLLISILMVAVNIHFTLTDRAWIIMGRPDEVYPELLYLFVGAPMAIAALSGMAVWTRVGGTPRVSSGLRRAVVGIGLFALAFSVLTAGSPFLPEGDGGIEPPSFVANTIFLGSPVLMLVQIVLSGVLLDQFLRR